MKKGVITIRKYGNRRLYDTSASRYINLDELAAMVRNGKEVSVVEAKTGEDLTRVTLTQIILEDAREQPSGLPLELLRQLIVATDEVGREFVMWYLKSAFQAYRKVQSGLHSGLSEMRSAALSPLEIMRGLVEGGAAEGGAAAEAEELRARVAELEKRAKPSKRKASRPKKGKSSGWRR